jgi:TatD DNase family protein
MKFVDSHCHIADNVFYKNLSNLIPKWKSKGIVKIGAMATNMKSINRIIEISKIYSNLVIPSIGRHPWGAHKVTSNDYKKIEQFIIENKNAIIGEIGLDRYFVKEKEKQDKQIPLFNFFLELAQKHNRSIMLHITGAEEVVYDILTTFKLKSNICCHWYSGSEEILKQLRDIGCYFTINPKFISSRSHKKVLKYVDKNRLLTESDGPVKFQGKVNSPEIIPILINQIASELKENKIKLARQIHQNYLDYLQN